MSEFAQEETNLSNLNSPPVATVQQIQEEVKKWLEIEGFRREHNEKVKEMRSDQKKIETQIINFMKDNKIPQFDFKNGEGRLSLSTTNNKSQIKPADLATILKNHVNTDQLENIMNNIESARTVKTKSSLKHSM